VYPRGYERDDSLWDCQFHEAMHMAAAFERASEFDVIHSHAYHHALPFTRLVGTPVVHTYHILPDPDIVRAYARYPEARLVAISRYQRSKLVDIPEVPVIYHGVDFDAFPFQASGGEYLLFLGRMSGAKGTLQAIEVAKAVGMRLVLAGPGDDEFFEAHVAPAIDGQFVDYVGPVGIEERNRLLAGAAALLYPIAVSEPFGLVMVEAMACGTPVAALDRGAVRDIIEIGRTGYYAADAESLAVQIPDTLALDRARVRQQAIQRFDYRRMTDEYEALYRRLARDRLRRAV
jgi:glycosyltransferase involved in cell wall biosynthesis